MVFNGNFQSLQSNGNGNGKGKQLPLESARFNLELPPSHEISFGVDRLLSILQRRWLWLVVVSLVVCTGVGAKVLLQPPRYASKFQLLVGTPTQDNQLANLSPALSNQINSNDTSIDYETQIQVLLSPRVLSPILDKIAQQAPNLDYGNFFSSLRIYRLGQTKILEVSYQDTNPEQVQLVLEKLAQGYIEHSRNQQQSSLKKGLEFTQEQLPILQERVNKLQAKLQHFRQQYDLIDPAIQAQSLSERLSKLVETTLETQTQLQETELLRAKLQGQLALDEPQAMAVAALSEAPRYQKLLNQLQEVETQLALETAKFTNNNPQIVRLQEQQQNLLPLLQQEAVAVLGTQAVSRNTQNLAASPNPLRLQLTQELVAATNNKQILQTRQQSLTSAETQLRQQIKNMATLVRQYTDLQRELQIATESLNHFLGVQENLEIEASQKAPAWHLLAESQLPQAPISPNRPRGLLIALMAGLMAGVGAALLAEKLDNSFHSVEELKDATQLPVVGTIPFVKNFKHPGHRQEQNSPSSASEHPHYAAMLDAFRSLHTNLHLLNPDQPLKSLVVSSPVPEEGKSTTAVYLAQAAAAMGQRVLLVDADLRRPQVHVMTDLPNVWGLCDLIAGELDMEDVIQRAPFEDQLHILSAGQIPPDPTRLLSSQKMRNLIEKLHEAFDLVIFDTPPLYGLIDAKLLVPYTNGLALVVSLGRSERAVLNQVLEGVKMSHLNLLGVIANQVKNSRTSYPDYYQRYYKPSNSKKVL